MARAMMQIERIGRPPKWFHPFYTLNAAKGQGHNRGRYRFPNNVGSLARYPSRLVHGQHLGNVSIGFGLAPINVGERLAI
jgi:hypothetical protein